MSEEQVQPQHALERIYTKDISFEAPNAPQVFQKDWQPEVKLDLDTASSQLAEGVYEVVLRVTVTASLGEETAFLCEVQQGGIFSIEGIDKQKVGQIAANVRRLRKDDPYKGKGIRYAGEQVRRKVGKTGK